MSLQRPAENLLQQPVQQEANASRIVLDGERGVPAPEARPQRVPDTDVLRPVQQTTTAAQSVNAGADLAETAFSRLQRPGPVADNRPFGTLAADAQLATVTRGDALPTSIAREIPQQAPVLPTLQDAQIPADSLKQAEMPLGQGALTAQSSQNTPTLVSQAPANPATSTTGAAVSQAQAPIDVPVRDTAWSGMLGERVLVMANNQLQNAEIRLTPAELGPLRVQVAVDDGAASVTFHAQHAITRDAIEQALPRLRELFAENGLTLGQADVGDQAGPDVQQGNREAAGEGARAEGVYGQTDEDAAVESVAAGERPRSSAEGLVDTFA